MAEIRSAIIPSDRTTYTDAPLIWSELTADEQASYAGGQFTTLTAFEAAKQSTLADQQTAVLFSFGTLGLRDEILIDGSTTSSDNYFNIDVYKEHRHIAGLFEADKAFISGTLKAYDSYTVINNLRMRGYDTAVRTYVLGSDANYNEINNCYIDANHIADMAAVYTTAGTSFNNCIFIHGDDDFTGNFRDGNGGSTLNNCVAYGANGTYAPGLRGTTSTVFNGCIAFGNTYRDFYSTDSDASSNYNVSGDTYVPANGTSIASFDFSTLFPNAATGDFRPAISYVSALGTTWGAGAIPWERDVVVDTSGGTGTPLITNGDFVTDLTGWSYGSPYSWVSGRVYADGTGTYASFSQTSSIPEYGQYSLTFDFEAVSGGVQPQIGTLTLGTFTNTGTYTISFMADASDVLSFTDTDGSSFYLDNISLTQGTNYYSSLSAAEAAEDDTGDLPLRNEKITFTCTSGGTTTADTTTNFSSWTTNESCFITIKAHENDRHNGKWDDSKYHIYHKATGDYQYCLKLSTIHKAVLDGLQLNSQNDDANSYLPHAWATHYLPVDGYTIVKNLFCKDTSSVLGDQGNVAYSSASGNNGEVQYNNIYHHYQTASDLAGETPSEFIGCTCNCFDSNSHITNGGTDNKFYNNILLGGLTNSYPVYNNSSGAWYEDNNLTNSTSPSGIYYDGNNDLDSVTVYDAAVDTLPVVPENCVIFKDLLNLDYRLVSHKVENYKGEMVETNVAIGNAAYIYDVEDDCAGKSREPYNFKGVRTQRSFDIGAWQAPAKLTYKVDTDGVSGDYSSLQTAYDVSEVDHSLDLVGSNVQLTFDLYASTMQADSSGFLIDTDVNTSKECNLVFINKAGEGVKFDKTQYWLNKKKSSAVFQIGASVFWITLQGIQVENLTSDWCSGIYLTNNVAPAKYGVTELCAFIDKCIVRGNKTITNSTTGISAHSYYGLTKITNCIAYDTGKYGMYFGRHCAVSNCTAFNCTNIGIQLSNYSATTMEDCISIYTSGDTPKDYKDDNTLTFETNNISSDLTGDITGLSSTYFKDPANGDFTPVASAGNLTSYSASANSTKTVGAIPYVDEKVVDTGGTGDYTSLAAWEAVAQSACVEGETARANCEASSGAADTTNVVISGFTTNSFIEVIGDNTSVKPDATKYALKTTSTDPALKLGANTSAKYLQIDTASNANGIEPSEWEQYVGFHIIGCLVTNTTNGIYWSNNSNQTDSANTIENCVIINTTANGIVRSGSKPANLLVKNCSTYNTNTAAGEWSDGISTAEASLKSYLMNCVSAAHTSGGNYSTCLGAYNEQCTHCVSSDGDAIGEGSIANHDFTGDFVSTTDLHTTDSPYALWGADAAYAGAFGDEPYEVVRLVDTDGVSGDHSTLADAISWFQTNRADLVTRNEKALINCQATTGVGDTAWVDVNNITTSLAHSIDIIGDLASGIYDTSKYHLDGSKNYGLIYSRIPFVNLVSLQLNSGSNGSSDALIYLNHKNKLENCIITGLSGHGVDSSSEAVICAINSLIYPLSANTNTFWGLYGSATYWVKNSVLIGDYVYTTASNNYCVNSWVDNFYNQASWTGNNNATPESSLFGIDNLVNQVATDIFTDPAGGDFTLKAGSNAIGAGADLSEYFTTDITGETRTTPWDIGAFKYVTSSGTPITVLFDLKTAIHNSSINSYDTTSAIHNTKAASADTISAIHNTISDSYDTSSNISNTVSDSYDTKSSISNLIAELYDTKEITLNYISNTYDTNANISLSTSIVVNFDTVAKIINSTTNTADLSAGISNDLITSADVKTIISTLVTSSADSKTKISIDKINTADLEASILNQLTESFDTKAVIKASVSIIEYFDTKLRISNDISSSFDTKTTVIVQNFENSETFIIRLDYVTSELSSLQSSITTEPVVDQAISSIAAVDISTELSSILTQQVLEPVTSVITTAELANPVVTIDKA